MKREIKISRETLKNGTKKEVSKKGNKLRGMVTKTA